MSFAASVDKRVAVFYTMGGPCTSCTECGCGGQYDSKDKTSCDTSKTCKLGSLMHDWHPDPIYVADAYCEAHRVMFDVNYFLSSTCVDGFQVADEWPGPADRVGDCSTTCQTHGGTYCSASWLEIEGEAVREAMNATVTKPEPMNATVAKPEAMNTTATEPCETYVTQVKHAIYKKVRPYCIQACLAAHTAKALGLSHQDKGTCAKYGYNPGKVEQPGVCDEGGHYKQKCCEEVTKKTYLYGELTAISCSRGD